MIIRGKLGLILGVLAILAIVFLRRKTDKNEYKDRTIKNYRRWHKW